jgi:hypothetical protein
VIRALALAVTLALLTGAARADTPMPLGVAAPDTKLVDQNGQSTKRVTFVVDRGGRIRYVEVGGLAIPTDRTLEALTRLARAK